MRAMRFLTRAGVALACLPALILSTGCFSNRPHRETIAYDGREARKAEVAGEIEAALDRGRALDPAARAAAWRDASQTLVARLGTNSDAGYLLSLGLDEAARSADPAPVLESRMDEALEALDFGIIVEADIPEGYPEPSPEGLIRVKTYPSVRMARVESEDGGFMTLFRHIQRNDISMTAPVEMQYGGEDRSAMAFLYASDRIGAAGADGVVDVSDTSPLTVVSVGFRGSYDVDEGREMLTDWLAANSDRWVASGELRVLGYNSPFVPWWMKYAEVQIPVRPVVRTAGLAR